LTEEEASILAEAEAGEAIVAPEPVEEAGAENVALVEAVETGAEFEPAPAEEPQPEAVDEGWAAEGEAGEPVAEGEWAPAAEEVYDEETAVESALEEGAELGEGDKKKKKTSRKRTLVFDPERGQLVAKKRRKPSRIRGWEYGEDE